jgi:hypothetical protein
MKGDGDRMERRHTKEIVDLVLKLSREDAETAGNLITSVFNDTSLTDAKVTFVQREILSAVTVPYHLLRGCQELVKTL